MVDDKGREHEVLLRSFIHGQETMYLLDRLASLLHSVNAQAGDMLMLTRDETGPVVRAGLQASNLYACNPPFHPCSPSTLYPIRHSRTVCSLS